MSCGAEIKMLVLDEADEMLNRGFKEQASSGHIRKSNEVYIENHRDVL